MVKRIMSWFMMGFVLAVLVVGFAQVLKPTPLQAHVCEHVGYPPCPTGFHFKYCFQWDDIGHDPGQYHQCCLCSWCVPDNGNPLPPKEVCWVD